MKTGADAPTSNPRKCFLMPDAPMTKDAEPQDHDPKSDRLLKELDAIQSGNSTLEPGSETAPADQRHARSHQTFLAPDPNDPDIIMPEVKLTRWDKASRKWRDLVAKREALPPDHPSQKVALLDQQIVTARKALKRAESDVERRQERIDEWRAGAGREVYNAGRRKKRATPNLNRKKADLTDAEKEQRKQDQTNDSRLVKRRRDAGIPEAKIQAELVARIRAREADRAAKARADEEQAELEKRSDFGLF